MEAAQLGQVTKSAAEIYEEFFVPALFSEWAARVVNAAGVATGHSVIDVACGTGVLARKAEREVGTKGMVVGLDRNEDMLEVARRMTPNIDWRHGQAESLPFPDHSFDAVVSQFGLMLFEGSSASLSEMWRVLRPDGKLAVAVWDKMDRMPGYAAMTHLLQTLFGDRVSDALEAPFVLGDPDVLMHLFAEADIPHARLETHDGTARYPSIGSWLHTDICGWTLAGMLDEDEYSTLSDVAEAHLKAFEQADGTVAFPSSAHIVIAAKS